MRWIRLCVVGALTAGIVLTVVAGVSFAAHAPGQVGYGATQVLGEQFIKPKSGSSSALGLWIGVFAAGGIIMVAVAVGAYRTQFAVTGTGAAAEEEFVEGVKPFVSDEETLHGLRAWFRKITFRGNP